MKLEKIKGSHSKNDKIILITSNREALELEDIFLLIEEMAENELNRIRIDKVRNEIISGIRPFYFEEMIDKIFKRVKEKLLK